MSIILLLVILIVNITLWILLFIRLRKEFSPDTVLSSIRDEVDKLIIEINRVADRDITLIEARRNGLKQLLDEVDKKLALQESLVKVKDEERKILKKLNRDDAPNLRENPSLFTDQAPGGLFGGFTEPQGVESKAQNNSDVEVLLNTTELKEVESTEQTPVLPVNPVQRVASVYKRNIISELNTEPAERIEKKEEPIHITFSSDPISPKQDKRRSVLKMAGEGFTAEVIAEKLKIPVREVSLIMDLYS